MNKTIPNPVVLCLSGSDPTGGAGIQADIETLASMGCHTLPVITTVTVQDTQDIKSYMPVDSDLLIQQARCVLEDSKVNAFKIGMLGSIENIAAICALIADYPDIPVVLDPVLLSGGGTELADKGFIEALMAMLVPVSNIITPNTIEARLLVPGADTIHACAQGMIDNGAEYALITGTHESSTLVTNRFYNNDGLIDSSDWERLPGSYHGSGCTLASAIAGLIAHNIEPVTTIREAQEFAWQSLKHGYRTGMGQYVPNRLFWSQIEPQDEPES